MPFHALGLSALEPSMCMSSRPSVMLTEYKVFLDIHIELRLYILNCVFGHSAKKLADIINVRYRLVS